MCAVNRSVFFKSPYDSYGMSEKIHRNTSKSRYITTYSCLKASSSDFGLHSAGTVQQWRHRGKNEIFRILNFHQSDTSAASVYWFTSFDVVNSHSRSTLFTCKRVAHMMPFNPFAVRMLFPSLLTGIAEFACFLIYSSNEFHPFCVALMASCCQWICLVSLWDEFFGMVFVPAIPFGRLLFLWHILMEFFKMFRREKLFSSIYRYISCIHLYIFIYFMAKLTVLYAVWSYTTRLR